MVPQPESSARYQTKDLGLASFLRCRNFCITEILEDEGRVKFLFENTPALQKALLDFVNDGMVHVRSFCSTVRDLKAITHSSHQRDKGRAALRTEREPHR